MNWKISDEHVENPLLRQRVFMTLPQSLLKAIKPALNKDELPAMKWKLEWDLGEISEKANTIVGFRNRLPISYDLLASGTPEKLAIDDELMKWMGWDKVLTTPQVRNALESFEPIADRVRIHRRAFAGWLMTSQQFVEEHEALCGQWQEHIVSKGFPNSATTTGLVHPGARKASGTLMEYLTACTQFYQRWQLAGMAAPGLPIPLSPQFPELLQPAHASDALHRFSLPATMPVPAGEELRAWTIDAVGRQS